MVIPRELTEPEIVTCRDYGDISRTLGQCAVDLRQGLDNANAKLSTIRDTWGSQ